MEFDEKLSPISKIEGAVYLVLEAAEIGIWISRPTYFFIARNKIPYMKPEAEARENIDEVLKQAGWTIQDLKELNLGASLGVAVREFPLVAGPAGYLLFVYRKAVGVF